MQTLAWIHSSTGIDVKLVSFLTLRKVKEGQQVKITISQNIISPWNMTTLKSFVLNSSYILLKSFKFRVMRLMFCFEVHDQVFIKIFFLILKSQLWKCKFTKLETLPKLITDFQKRKIKFMSRPLNMKKIVFNHLN